MTYKIECYFGNSSKNPVMLEYKEKRVFECCGTCERWERGICGNARCVEYLGKETNVWFCCGMEYLNPFLPDAYYYWATRCEGDDLAIPTV